MDNDENTVETVEETQEVTEEAQETEVGTTEGKPEEEINWQERALKAEKAIEKAKAKAKLQPKPIEGNLSATDILALSKSNIETDDMEEVIKFADYSKLRVADALKSPVLKAILADKAEVRKSAQAVNTGSVRRGSNSISDEKLMENARNGILPDSPSEIQRLTDLRLRAKR